MKRKDPFRKREAEKYEVPVPSREYIIEYLEETDKPLSFNHMIDAFGLKSDEEVEGLRRRLIAMERDGQLISNRRGKYGLVKKMDLIPGVVEGHKDGFGFLIPDDGSKDIFLPERQMRLVFPNDRALVRVTGMSRDRREGMIVEVLERNTLRIAGRFYVEGGSAFIDPDIKAVTQDIIIPPGQEGNAKSGQFVVAEITTQPSVRRQPLGKVVEILGDHLTPGMELELAVRSHNLPFQWPESVKHEVQFFPKAVQEKDLAGRKDLRSLSFVTIDGEDAKDFDDAVYCEKNKKGWKLWVAIADVAHYVKPNSELDKEAQKRGNSVYFPSSVIPMLPEILSNELCSLKAKVDRLVMVCEMDIDSSGKMKNYEIYEGVIHSKERLTYTQVAALLAGESQDKQHLLPQLKIYHDLFNQLLKERETRGAIEFESVETRIIFDDTGKIKQIVPVKRNDAHKMIEEAMLLANRAVAAFLLEAEVATLYRIHQGPDEIKLETLRDFLKAFGLRLSGGKNPTPMDYAKLLRRIENRPDAHLLQIVMLRSLRQAVYSPKNSGHFGLAFDVYCHFTSPIRRYPDLLVHRGLKHLLQKKKPERFLYNYLEMEKLGEECSMTERRADDATRDAVNWLKSEYMLDKVGQTFDGIISGVTGFGIFVELKNIFVEGLVHITALVNDYYQHDPTNFLLRGKYSGKTYRLGDPIRVIVARVDLDQREIDFELADVQEKKIKKKSKKKKRRK